MTCLICGVDAFVTENSLRKLEIGGGFSKFGHFATCRQLQTQTQQQTQKEHQQDDKLKSHQVAIMFLISSTNHQKRCDVCLTRVCYHPGGESPLMTDWFQKNLRWVNMWTELWGALRAAGLRDECVGDTRAQRVWGEKSWGKKIPGFF